MRRLPFALSFFAFVFVICSLPSCKKSSSGSSEGDYYIRFKANGKQQVFKSQDIAQITYLTSDQLHSCVIGGYADFGQNTQSLISIVLFSNEPIAAGTTYQDPQKATREDGGKVPRCLLDYTDAQKNGYLTMGPAVDENGHSAIAGIMADASVTITELTEHSIKGNFSGTAYLSTDATLTDKQLITEGSFYLKLVQ